MLLPVKKFLFNSISAGIFPLWNPYLLSGIPFFADITAGTYYAPYLSLFLLPTMQGLSLLVVAHFFIAAFFMYKLAKLFDLSNLAALVCGITFSLSGLLINYIADPSRLFVVCLYPLFFYSLLRMLQDNTVRWLCVSAIVLASQIFAGHIQYVLIEVLFTPFFLLVTPEIKLKTSVLYLSAVLILGVLLSSIILLPALELLPLTTRSEIYRDASIFDNFSLQLPSLIRFVFAHFWGIKNAGSAWGIKDTSTVGYIGFIPLVLIGLNLRKMLMTRKTLIFMVCSGISLAISFGNHLPFFRLFVDYIPLFKIFRNPMAYLAFYTFSLAILTGYAFDLLRSNIIGKRLSAGFLLISIVAFTGYLFLLFNKNIPYQLLVLAAGALHKNLSLFHTPEVDLIIARFITVNIAVICFLAFIGFRARRKEILLSIILIDLFIFTKSNFFTLDKQIFNQNHPPVDFLKKNLGSDRYLSSSEVIPYSGTYNLFSSLSFQPPFSKENYRLDQYNFPQKLTHELDLIPPNFAMQYGIPAIDGISAFIFKDYADLFQKKDHVNEIYNELSQYNPYINDVKSDITLTKLDFSEVSFNDKIFDILGTKYIVTDRDLHLSHHKKVFENNNISIYENLNALSRIMLVNDKNQPVETPEIIYENPNLIKVKTHQKGLLILHDVYYPGWKAYINGMETKILPQERVFRSVNMDKDESMVEFRFEPLSFRYGVIISGISWLFVLVILIKNKIIKKFTKI